MSQGSDAAIESIRMVQSLAVGPDDVIVVTVPHVGTDLHALRDALRGLWPENRMVCLTPGMTLDALPPAEMARHGWVRAEGCG